MMLDIAGGANRCYDDGFEESEIVVDVILNE